MIVVFFSPLVMSDSATPWTTACQASLSLTISQSLPKFLSVVSVMPSSHLILWCPFSFCPQSFPASGTFLMSWLFTLDDQNTGASASASVLSMSIQGWFPLRIDWFDLAVQATFGCLLQHHNLKASVLWCSAFFTIPFSQPFMTTGKTIALTIQTILGKVMSLVFNTLSRFVIAFLSRSIWFHGCSHRL